MGNILVEYCDGTDERLRKRLEHIDDNKVVINGELCINKECIDTLDIDTEEIGYTNIGIIKSHIGYMKCKSNKINTQPSLIASCNIIRIHSSNIDRIELHEFMHGRMEIIRSNISKIVCTLNAEDKDHMLRLEIRESNINKYECNAKFCLKCINETSEYINTVKINDTNFGYNYLYLLIMKLIKMNTHSMDLTNDEITYNMSNHHFLDKMINRAQCSNEKIITVRKESNIERDIDTLQKHCNNIIMIKYKKQLDRARALDFSGVMVLCK